MKALVTGGAGFIGSHIVHALLDRGDDVVVFDHRLADKCLSVPALRKVRAIESDIFNRAAVCEAAVGCQVIFHCAALVGVEAYSRYPAKTMEVEEAGLRNVCAAAVAVKGAYVVYTSSSAVYGAAGGDLGLDETLPVAPTSNYGIAKRFNESYLASQYSEHGLASAALRIFNVYGPRQDERLVIPRFIRRALAGKDIEIFSDGRQTRDFVYIDDVVKAALACANRAARCEIINVCSGRETSILGLSELIIRLTESSSKIIRLEPPASRASFEVPRCFGSREKLQRLFEGIDPTPLESGLANTIEAARSIT